MYVCVCKAVTDKQIKAAIAQGACSRRQLYQCTGAGNVCGKCTNHIKQMLNEESNIHTMKQAA